MLRGKYPEGFKSQGTVILETGMAVPFSPAILRRRQQLGIPELEMADVNEIQTLFKETQLDKKLAYDWSAAKKKEG